MVQLDTSEGGVRFRCWSSSRHVELELWHSTSERAWVAEVDSETARSIVLLLPNLHAVFERLSTSACAFQELREDDAGPASDSAPVEPQEQLLLMRARSPIQADEFELAVRKMTSLLLIDVESHGDALGKAAADAKTGEILFVHDTERGHVRVSKAGAQKTALRSTASALGCELYQLSISDAGATLKLVPLG